MTTIVSSRTIFGIRRARTRAWLAFLVAFATMVLAISTVGQTGTAHADTAPPDSSPLTMSSDALPTAQVGDGTNPDAAAEPHSAVVWAQVVIGNIVYVGGNFTTARPAGVAAGGAGQVARSNLMAYDITTGVMTSFGPVANAPVRALTAVGNTLYVGGEFTQMNGVARYRVAAFDVTNPSAPVLTNFAPKLNSTVKAIYANATAVYLGGIFTSVDTCAVSNVTGCNATRTGAASVSVATRTVTGFNPVLAGGTPLAITASPDNSKVVVGGSFTTTNGVGSPGSANGGYGLALLSSINGANLPLPINATLVRDGGTKAAIESLVPVPDGSGFYGTGYSFQRSTGNTEGVFKSDWNGNRIWIEDCHGDTYSVFPSNGVVYETGHAHFCGNLGGFPQTNPFTFQHALAFTDTVDSSRVIQKDQLGYFNFEGQPQPKLLHWYPDMDSGTYTGQSQAAWNVSGNNDYVVYGGEFPTVNNKAQQSLVRFGRTALAPNTDGPRLSGPNFVPTITSFAQGLRLSWPANYDRDNIRLSYALLKDPGAQQIYTTTVDSTFWQRPQMSYFDTSVTPGTPVTYRLQVTDPKGNVKLGDKITVTPNGGTSLSSYERTVLNDKPLYYWPLDETSGTTAADISGNAENGTIGTGVTKPVPGAIPGDSSTAFRFPGTSTGNLATTVLRQGIMTFSVEAWFKTTSTNGGKIIGWGTSSGGASTSSDRMLYMGKTGKLYFGVNPGAIKTVASTGTYRNGAWHHAVGTLGTDGMKLYVDGALVGSLASISTAQMNSGYWRIGSDTVPTTYPDAPTSGTYFNGDVDNAAVYNTVLTPAQVSAHANPPANAAPTAAFTSSTSSLTASFNGSTSADPDGTVASYSWNYGDGTAAGTGATSSHTYTTAGTYSVTLTVTDNGGATGTVTNPVTVTAAPPANSPPTAAFTSTTNSLSATFDASTSTDSDGTIGSYAWSFGDTAGGTATGANPTYGYAAAGTYQVTLTVTDNGGATNSVTKAVTVTAAPPANSPPNAAFTFTTNNLIATFNGSVSSDSDGTIASYAWDFGDGGTDTGATPSPHTYTAAGTYTVTLTVTDNGGATNVQTHTVAVTDAPPANSPPNAVFTFTTTDLTATFNGSGSTDSDGSIVSYAWDFGDGGTATGATPSPHTYTAAGPYTVTLTVTDNGGATNVQSHTVTVTAPAGNPAFASDTFERTVASGWGTADTGGAWTVLGGASSLSVGSGVGRINLAAASAQKTAYLGSTLKTDTDLTLNLSPDKVPNGSGVYLTVLGRRVGTNLDYHATVKLLSTGKATVSLGAFEGSTTEVSLASAVTVPGTYAAGDQVHIRLQTFGNGSTTVRAKVWLGSVGEPDAWTVNKTADTYAGLQAPGAVGLTAYLSSSSTNFPVNINVQDLAARPTV